jgi:Phage minor capsid protein 2
MAEVDIKVVDNLSDIYKSAEEKILKAMKGKDLFQQAEKQKMLNQIRSILQSTYEPTAKWIDTNTAKEYQSGIDEVDRAFEAVDIKASFNLISPEALKYLVSTNTDIGEGVKSQVKSLLGNSYANIEKLTNQVSQQIRSELLKEIGVGQVIGTARYKIADELYFVLARKGITGFTSTNKNGTDVNYSLESYVHRLTQSALINSRAAAVVSRSLDRNHDLVQVSNHLKPSPMCESHQGQIVSLTGQTKGYPTLDSITCKSDFKKGGIFHPYCRHSLTVYFET